MDTYDREPTAAELAAIEAEWPVIEAELALLDAEITALSHDNGPSPLDWRRVRRARRRVLAARLRAGHRSPHGIDGTSPGGENDEEAS